MGRIISENNGKKCLKHQSVLVSIPTKRSNQNHNLWVKEDQKAAILGMVYTILYHFIPPIR
jgi:hypothetical protein